MFSALLNAPCELQLHLLQTVIFLYPTNRPVDRNNTELPPAQTDSLVRGLVELYVPSRRHISGIKVKLRAIQTVAILDANTGVIPISWEDELLMEKEVYIGMQPKGKKKEDKAKVERGRTPGPSSNIAHSSRPPSLERSGSSHHSSTPASVAGSRDVTARNSRETPRHEIAEPGLDGATTPSHEHDSHSLAANIGSAFARAVSRGRAPRNPRTGSRPQSRNPSRSRPSSPSDDRRQPPPYASSSNAVPRRSISGATTSLNSSPMVSPREERPRPSLTPSSSRRRISEDLDMAGLTLERGRSGNAQASSLGHPDDDDFGIRRPSPLSRDNSDHTGTSGPGLASARQSSYGPPSIGGLVKRRDASKEAGASSHDRSSQRSTSKGWGRWGRSVSRARGGAPRDPSVASTARHELHHHQDEEPAEGIELEKGVHGFEFAFIIPADSPEYTRSPFGRVRYVIKATAYGAGRARSNLEAFRDCFPVANPSMEGGPTPLTVLYNDLHPTVGLLSIACTAQNISVGGLFQLDIHSPVPPPDLIIYMVRVSLDTTIELKTKRKGRQTVPIQRHKLFEKGYVPPGKNDVHGDGDGKKSEGYVRDPARDGAESAWTVQGLARMPDDNSIRSSTIGGTKASIRFSHLLIVEVVHSRQATPDADRRLKVFTLRQPITLPSCCVAFDAATLPAYTPADDDPSHAAVGGLPYDLAHLPDGAVRPSGGAGAANGSANGEQGGATTPGAGPQRPSTLERLRGQGHEYCVCGLSLQDLEVRERAMIPVGGNYDIPIDNLRPHGKIGEIPLSRTRTGSTSRSRRRSSVSSQRSASLMGGGGRRGSGSSGVAGALARSLSRGGPSSRGRSPSSSSTDRRSGSLARSRTRESAHSPAGGGAEYAGGSHIARNTSRGSSRLGVYSSTADPSGGGGGGGNGRSGSSSTTSLPSSSGATAPPPTTSSLGTTLDSSTVTEQPSRAASPEHTATISHGDLPPSYPTVVAEVDESAIADDEDDDDDDAREGDAEIEELTRGRRR